MTKETEKLAHSVFKSAESFAKPDMSSSDVVEVVRCKDCKWHKDFDGCFFSTAECEPEHFCSWGVKLKTLCDSLLKSDSDECKEQKSKLDCISRQDAIEALDRIGSVDTEADREYARDIFDNLPPVTPTERTGEWKYTMTYYPYCSECDWMPEEDEMRHGHYDYCPNCGAKMVDGGDV